MGDTSEFDTYRQLEIVGLCDSVRVVSPKTGVIHSIKVDELKYDVRSRKTVKISLANTTMRPLAEALKAGQIDLREENKRLSDALKKEKEDVRNFIQTSANGKNSIYHGPDEPAGNFTEGDVWFKEVAGGEVEQWIWTGLVWKRIMHSGFSEEGRQEIDKVTKEAEKKINDAMTEHDSKVASIEERVSQNEGRINNFSENVAVAVETVNNGLSNFNNTLTGIRNDIGSNTEAANSAKATALKAVSDFNTYKEQIARENTSNFESIRNDIQDVNGRIIGFEEKIKKQVVGSRNLLKGARDWSGSWNLLDRYSRVSEDFYGLKVLSRTGAWYGINQGVKATPGLTYTFSTWVKLLDNPSSGTLRIYVSNSNHNFIERHNQSYFKLLDDVQIGKWVRVSHTFTTIGEGMIEGRIEANKSDMRFLIAGPQLEIGNVMSDFHTNDNDVSEEEMTYRSGLDETLRTYRSTVNNLQSGQTRLESSVQQNAAQIREKLNSSQVEGIINQKGYATVSHVSAEITKSANNISSEINSVRSSINSIGPSIEAKVDTKYKSRIEQAEGRITNLVSKFEDDGNVISRMNTRIDQTESGIRERITSDQLNQKLDAKGYATVTSMNAAIDRSANSFRSELTTTNAKISGLYSGSRNLLRASKTLDSRIWRSYNSATDEYYNGYRVFRKHRPAGSGYTEGMHYNFEPDGYKFNSREYVLSFWARTSSSTPATIQCFLYNPNSLKKVEASTGYTQNAVDGRCDVVIAGGNVWQRYWVRYTYNAPVNNKQTLIIGRILDENKEVFIAGPALYEGHLTIDASEAPEDLYGHVESVKTSIISQTNNSITTAVSNLSNANGVIGQLNTKVRQLEGSITQKVSSSTYNTDIQSLRGEIRGVTEGLPRTTTGANYFDINTMSVNDSYVKDLVREEDQFSFRFVNTNNVMRWNSIYSNTHLRNPKLLAYPGETVHFSCDVYSDRDVILDYDVNNKVLYGTTSTNDNDDIRKRSKYTNIEIPANKWTKVHVTYVARENTPINDWNSNFGFKTTADTNIKIRRPYMGVGDILGDYVPYKTPYATLKTNIIRDTENERRQLIQNVVTPMIPTGTANLLRDTRFENMLSSRNELRFWQQNGSYARIVEDFPSSMTSGIAYVKRVSENTSGRERNKIMNWVHFKSSGSQGNRYQGIQQTVDIDEAKPITISLGVKKGSSNTSHIDIIIHYVSGSSSSYVSQESFTIRNEDITTKYKRFSHTFNGMSSSSSGVKVIIVGTVGIHDFYISQPKLELGKSATDYSESPYDVATINQYHEVKDTVDGHTRTISNTQSELSRVQQTAAGIVSTVEQINSSAVNLNNDYSMIKGLNNQSVVGSGGRFTTEWFKDTSLESGGYLRVKCITPPSSGGCHFPAFAGITAGPQDVAYSWAVYARSNRQITLQSFGKEPLHGKAQTITPSWNVIRNHGVPKRQYNSFVMYNPVGGWSAGDYIDLYGYTLKKTSIPIDPEPAKDDITISKINLESILPRLNDAYRAYEDPAFKSSTWGDGWIYSYDNVVNDISDDRSGANTYRKRTKRGHTDYVICRTEPVDSTNPFKEGNQLKITSVGKYHTPTTYGGMYRTIQENNVFKNGQEWVIKVIAKIPKGLTITIHNNSIGSGGIKKYLNSNLGTGEWEEYYFYYKFGTNPITNGDCIGYFSIEDAKGVGANTIDWYVAFIQWYCLQGVDEGNKAIKTQVSQLAGSWAVRNLTSNNSIVAQINLTGNDVRIQGKNIRLDGNTIIDNAVVKNAHIADLSISNSKIANASIDNSKITSLDVNKVTGLTADFIKARIGTAIVDMLKGKVIQATNGNMSIDLINGNIRMSTGSNAIYRQSPDGIHTGFVHFNETTRGGIYAAIGVTSSRDGINSSSSGRFSGIRCFRTSQYGASHETSEDQIEIYGDHVIFGHSFGGSGKMYLDPIDLDGNFDLVEILARFNHNFKHLKNITGRGDVILTWNNIKRGFSG